MIMRFLVIFCNLRRNVVFPVPALPVRKMFLWVYWA